MGPFIPPLPVESCELCKQLFSSFANSLILVFSSSYAGSRLHLLSEGCALVWGMFVRWLCTSRPLLGSYVHQESI